MNYRWKIAVLAMLGLTTAACCGTKKAAKGEDQATTVVEGEGVDAQIKLMYGVPAPDGRMPKPISDTLPQHVRPAAPFPDGSLVKEMSEEEAIKLREVLEQEEAKARAEAANTEAKQ